MRAASLALVLSLVACNREQAPASDPPEGSGGAGDGPDVDGFTFQSEHERDATFEDYIDEDDAHEVDTTGFEVKSVEQARSLAEDAVAGELNPKKEWKTSPAFPATWPSEGPDVIFYFYPMALHPTSMSTYELFSAQYAVTVSLTDGATEVFTLRKARRLGTIEEARPTMLERRELELAESSLVYMLMGADEISGENKFWGYLKYFNEHPALGRDRKKRQPKFVKWLDSRPHWRG